MEKTTSKTFLYHSANGETYTKLLDITSYPDLFSAPEKLDISTLSSNQKKYAPGMVNLPDYEFGFIYDKTTYAAVKTLEDGKDTHHYQLRFGENGEYGAWTWTGSHFATPSGGNVGSVREGRLVCYPTSEVTETTIS